MRSNAPVTFLFERAFTTYECLAAGRI